MDYPFDMTDAQKNVWDTFYAQVDDEVRTCLIRAKEAALAAKTGNGRVRRAMRDLVDYWTQRARAASFTDRREGHALREEAIQAEVGITFYGEII